MVFSKDNFSKNAHRYAQATQLVHGGTQRSPWGETSEGLFLTSGYVYTTAEEAEARFKGEQEGYIYSRFSNPTVRMFEERMALLEGTDKAVATASGMAAVTATFLCYLKAGDHVVSSRALFSSCAYVIEEVLPRFGIEVSLVDGRDCEAWAKAVRPNSKMFFLESPSNPTLELVDIKAVAKIAHSCGALLVVDNVFASPLLQQPCQLGADIVVYSATKHIDGQGRTLGGVILGSKNFMEDHLGPFFRHTGPAISPFNAWVLLKSLVTLPLRMKAHCHNAAIVADGLSAHKKVRRVFYPWRKDHPQYALAKKQMLGGGSMIAFEVVGGKRAAFRLANALQLVAISNNLGDAKSLITHPATSTHHNLTKEKLAQLNITSGLLRLSVGLEDAKDITNDLFQALDSL